MSEMKVCKICGKIISKSENVKSTLPEIFGAKFVVTIEDMDKHNIEDMEYINRQLGKYKDMETLYLCWECYLDVYFARGADDGR
jgi:hypothetical protein